MNTDKARKEVKQICDVVKMTLETQVDQDDVDGLIKKGLELSSLAANMARMEAIAQGIYQGQKAEFVKKLSAENPDKSITYIRELAAGEAWEDESLYQYTVRLGRNISHTLDFIRTLLSLKKTEMEKGLYSGQVTAQP